jgi:hypothetical protein
VSLNGQNNTQNVLQSYLNRLQELENACWAWLQSMSISAASGDLLNKLGNLVGESRLGRIDADYQAAIRLRIRVNISSGRAVDVIAVATLANAPTLPIYVETGVAAWVLDLFGLASPATVAAKLSHTRAAGTYGVMQYTDPGTVNPMVMASGYGSDVPALASLAMASGYGIDVANPGMLSGAFPV